MTLDRLDFLPTALLDIGPRDIKRVFPNPTLIELKGDTTPPLFVSTVLHGNETTSFFALQHLARRYATTSPPRDLMIFIGNVEAMARGARRLDGGEDFNRVWAGGKTPPAMLCHQVLEHARARSPFASIDIHNNTGRNPIYGCVNALRPADLHLAARFASLGVFYTNPATTQSVAFSKFCPAITVECGQNDDQEGIERVCALLDAIVGLDRFPQVAPGPAALRLYETVGRVVVDDDARLSFNGAAGDIVFADGLEDKNFSMMPAGAPWARATPCGVTALRVLDEHGHDLTGDFFVQDAGLLRLKMPALPAMITTDRQVIAQDCLCYLMLPLER